MADDIPVWTKPKGTTDRWHKTKDIKHPHVQRYREKMRDVRAVFFDGTPDTLEAIRAITAHTPEITEVRADGIVRDGVFCQVPLVCVIGQMGHVSVWTEEDFTSIFEPAPGP